MTKFNGNVQGKGKACISLVYGGFLEAKLCSLLLTLFRAVYPAALGSISWCPTYAPGSDEDHIVGTALHWLEPPQLLLRRGTDLADFLLQSSLNIILILLPLTSRRPLLMIWKLHTRHPILGEYRATAPAVHTPPAKHHRARGAAGDRPAPPLQPAPGLRFTSSQKPARPCTRWVRTGFLHSGRWSVKSTLAT